MAMTQKQQVLRHLRNCGSITQMIATKRYQILRLAARIHELRKERRLINDVYVSRNGKRYKAYSLVSP
jgi:hypothetical protein